MSTTNKGPPKRAATPAHTQELVLLEAGYMCGNPQCRHILTLQLHHMVRVSDGGGNEAVNLIALCPNCHALHHQGTIPAGAIRVWKGMLVSLNSVQRGNLDTLLHLYSMEQDSFGRNVVYSGDTLIALAGLLRSGLVETGSASASSGGGGHPPYSAFQVRLTPRGLALVEASLSGDEQRYLDALK